MHYFTVQSIKFTLVAMGLFGVFAMVQDNDYHEIVDNAKSRVYNCDMLIGAWHPDIPAIVFDKCKQMKEEYVKAHQKQSVIKIN